MIYLNDQQLCELLDYPRLIDALEVAFRTSEAPPDHLHYTIGAADAPDGHLLLMPAWRSGHKMGISRRFARGR